MKFTGTLLIVFLCSISLVFAQEVPEEKYSQFTYRRDITYKNDSILIQVINPLKSPLRIRFFSKHLFENNILKDTLHFVLQEQSSLEHKIFAPELKPALFTYYMESALGDDEKEIDKNTLSLPFPKQKEYTIMQSFNGSFSHQEDYSRHAIDFNFKVGDTITSADDGFVVGVIKDYEYGGNDEKWRNLANFITIYHPHSGLFTQYVHLQKNGSFVQVGDAVKRNQPIGLSGETGFVSGPHLHFNVLIPEKNKTLKSVPFRFENNLRSKRLKKNMKVKNSQ